MSYVAATITVLGTWAILALLGIFPCFIARRSDNERKRRPRSSISWAPDRICMRGRTSRKPDIEL